MKNWKRYLSIAMTLAMLLGVLPTAAFADGETALTVDNVTVEAATYSGTAQTPVIKIGGNTAQKDVDYTYSVAEGKELKNADTYSLTITGMGAYSGSVQKTFTIARRTMTAADFTLTECTYSGSAVKPVVKIGGTELTEETDYTITCTNNINAGEANATVTFMGNYEGQDIAKTFQINPKSVEQLTITLGSETQTYDGNKKTPSVTVKDGETDLTDAHYTVGYGDNINAGENAGTVTITAKAGTNYTGSTTVNFTIQPMTVSADDVTVTIPEITYGQDPKPVVTYNNATLPDTGYEVTYSGTNAGSQTATVKLKGNYDCTKTQTFTIKAKTLETPTVSDIAAQTYTGSAITPTVTVTDGETTLTKDTDYTVTYSNNTNAAAADAQNAPTATVTFKGNYTGDPVTKTFTISPKSISDAVLGGLNSTYNPGSSPRPTVTLDGKTLEEGTDYDLDYDRNTSGSLGIKVDGKGNYTGTKQATVAVLATSDTTAPVISGVSNGGTYNEAKTITVTDTNLEKVEIYQGTTLVNNLTPAAGTTTVSTTLALSDTAYVIKAYDKVGNKTEFTVTVTRKSITASMITIADADNIVFDGTAKTPAITVKDGTTTIAADQYTLSWENNTNAGTATVKVTMKSDATAYKGEATKTFTIKPKTITSSSAIADIADQTYTGSPLTPTITVKDGTTTLVMGSDKDYTVIYSDNTNPGTAKVTVVLRGNYLGVLQKTFTINPNLTVLADNIKTLAAKTTLTYAEQQQAKQLKAAYDSLSAENKAIVDAAVGTTLMASFKNKVSAAAYKLLNKPAVGYYKHVQGTSSNVAIKIDADFSRTLVTEIRMGKYDTVIDPANYTVTEGSVVVTLSSSYLKTIKTTGKYNLYIDLTDIQTGHTETLQTVVRIVPATDIPQTGDPFRMNLWIGLLGASVLALAGLGVYEVLKKKKNSQKRLEAAMDLGENADKVDIPE